MNNNSNITDILQQFWLLDSSEYSIIKDLIRQEIKRLDEELYTPDQNNEEEVRIYEESKRLRDFYIVMKEKVDYIISMGLCKQHGIND